MSSDPAASLRQTLQNLSPNRQSGEPPTPPPFTHYHPSPRPFLHPPTITTSMYTHAATSTLTHAHTDSQTHRTETGREPPPRVNPPREDHSNGNMEPPPAWARNFAPGSLPSKQFCTSRLCSETKRLRLIAEMCGDLRRQVLTTTLVNEQVACYTLKPLSTLR